MTDVHSARMFRNTAGRLASLQTQSHGIIDRPLTGRVRAFLRPFDVSAATTVTALHLLQAVDTANYVSLRGASKMISLGAGWTLSDAEYVRTIGANCLVYLEYARTTAAVTIKDAATAALAFVSPDDYVYRPLWYISFYDGAIDLDNCIDLRASYFVDGVS